MEEKVKITIDTVLVMDFDYVRQILYSYVSLHADIAPSDKDSIIELMGYYPSIYNWISELYVFMINRVRRDPKNKDYLSRRDMLEQVLKDIRFQYDSLSRKITVMRDEVDDTGRTGV